MYSTETCHFCSANLYFLEKYNDGTRYCKACHLTHRYNITTSFNNLDAWVVTFRIKEYYFQMFHNVWDEPKEKLEIVISPLEIISIPECRLITVDNYLEEIERARKLQVFK